MSNEENSNSNGKSYGLKVFDATHFFNNKRSNQLQVHSTAPYLKDGKWINSGSFRLTITKFGEQNQVNAVKLTYAEACELYNRLGFALLNSHMAEMRFDSENIF